MTPAVSLKGITVRFGAVTALENVDLEVEAGTLHAVVGENGAGKTTLMRVLYGAQRPTEGTIEVEGKERRFSGSAEAIAAGVGMVSQHYAIIPELTCLQNLMLGAEPGAAIAQNVARERAQQLAERMGFRFDWDRPASELGPAGAQKLEILKLLWRNARIMILDEPTAMLSPSDGEALFDSLRTLVDAGATVILVTHRLPEVLNHCSRVTVLRAGRRVADLAVSETDAASLARLIVGDNEFDAITGVLEAALVGEPVLEVKGLTVRDARGHEALKGVSLQVRAGEVVGIAGVDGNGQRELFQAVVGTGDVREGTVSLGGSDMSHAATARRIESGLRLIPEDRHEEGVVEGWSLEENSALGLQRDPSLRSGGKIDEAARHRWAEAVAARFKTRHGGLGLPMASLSGGNQQRFVAARALEHSPRVLLAFSPTRGLDLKGTADVYAAIREQAREGMAALVVSFDLDELLEHCDRIVVLNHGRLTEPATRDRDAIGREMVGA
ncbi:ABC transporter ATP-binding protein [bacterium]|nr:MAG: ABC transporter ATP-binding protein [bacterium]